MQSYIPFLPYTLINLIIITSWIIHKKNLLIITSVLVALSGLMTGNLKPSGLFILSTYGALTHGLANNKLPVLLKILFGIFFSIFTVGLMAHMLPGFNNVKFFDSVKFSEQSLPFTMYLNFDKPFVGLALLSFLKIEKVKSFSEAIYVFKKSLPIYLSLLALILPIALMMNYLSFDPKYPKLGWVWMVNNLIVVCVVEELFFRGLIQNKLKYIFKKNQYGSFIAVLSTSLLFALAHYKGGISYIILSLVAGLFYGMAFEKVKRIEAAIFVHFLLNLTHFLLFSYPALNSTT